MGRKENLAVFESGNISKTREVTLTKIGVHVCYINTYLHEFFEPIIFDSLNFLMTMDYSPWVKRKIWLFLKVAISPKPERSRSPKLMCMHMTSSPTCMNFLSQFQSVKFFDDHGL